jgi:hypothetical protein
MLLIVMNLQPIDAYSGLDRSSELLEARRAPVSVKEDVYIISNEMQPFFKHGQNM